MINILKPKTTNLFLKNATFIREKINISILHQQFSSINDIKSYKDIPSQTFNDNNSEKVKINDKKEILLSGGGCAISFQAGYMHGLQEFIPRSILKQYRFGGVSSGSVVACLSLCSIHSNKDMKYWYEKYIRQNLELISSSRLGFLSSTKFMAINAKNVYEEAQQLQVPINGALHLFISPRISFYGLRKHLVDTFNDSQSFAEAVSCSCSIPFVTSNTYSSLFQGIKAIDGGFTMPLPFRDLDSDCIFLNVLPKLFSEYPVVREKPDFLCIFQIAQGYNLSFPRDYFKFDVQTADTFFLNGYHSAHAQKSKLIRAFRLE